MSAAESERSLMMRIRTLMLLGAFALWPSVASAQWGWLEFLEELSGPGPFKGYTVGLRLVCTRADDRGTLSTSAWGLCLSDNDPRFRQLVELRGAYLWTGEGDRPRFEDAPADKRAVKAFRLESTAAVRLSPMLDIGAGVGFVRFWGEGFDPLWRPSLIPISVTFTPFAIGVNPNAAGSALKRAFKIRLEEKYFPIGFTGADFGHPESSYTTDGDWVFSAGLVVDVGFLFDRR